MPELPIAAASLVVARGPGSQAQHVWLMGLLPLGMWGLPRPGIEAGSPALQGFLTTGPLEKPHGLLYKQ